MMPENLKGEEFLDYVIEKANDGDEMAKVTLAFLHDLLQKCNSILPPTNDDKPNDNVIEFR